MPSHLYVFKESTKLTMTRTRSSTEVRLDETLDRPVKRFWTSRVSTIEVGRDDGRVSWSEYESSR